MSSTADVHESTEPRTQFERLDRELRALKLALAESHSFRLMLATYSDKTFRDGLIQRLIADLEKQGVSVGVLDLSRRPAGDDASLPLVLLKAVREVYRHTNVKTDRQVAILVINLEDHIQETRKGGQEVLETANLHRDLFPEACPAPTVLWLAPWATTALARSAPDLWHWRAATFDFTTPMQPQVIDGSRRQEPNFADFAFIDDEGIQELARELAELTQGSVATTARGQAHAARLRLQLGDALFLRGEWDRALTLFQEAEKAFAELSDVRSKAVTLGKIADILFARGALDEALRTLRKEALPAFERLGDVRSVAVTKGKIADILQARGELTEALRIRTEEEIPVYERLGDVRSKAVTLGQIADILFRRGELDEALRIRTEEQIPVYERLGDVRSKAVTLGKIADILFARGELDEALRIRTEEEIPVFERLGDIREKGVALWKLSQIALAREDWKMAALQLAESYRIFESLGEAEGIAVVGEIFGQRLVAAERREAGLAVLRRSEMAYRKLGLSAEADGVAEIIAANAAASAEGEGTEGSS